MKITVDAETLLAALRNNVAEKKSSAVIYTHVLLDAHGIGECGHLRITSLNLAEKLSTVIKTTSNDECGEATVNPVELMRVLNGLRGDVNIEQKPGQLLITQVAQNGTRRFKLNSLPGKDFPLSDETNRADIAVDAAEIATALARVKYAAAKNDAGRPAINGVLISGDLIAATDGHRAALITLNQKIPYEIIIPIGCLQNLINSLQADNARLQATLTVDNKPSEICVLTDSQSYSCRMVDAKYPDILRIVPASVAASKIEINCRDAAPVIDRAIPLEQSIGTDGAPTKFKCSPLMLTFNKRMLRISGEHVDDFINCAASAEAEIKINASYLSDLLHLGKDDDLMMHLFSANQACLFLLGANEKHIIMPMKV